MLSEVRQAQYDSKWRVVIMKHYSNKICRYKLNLCQSHVYE